MYQIQCPQTLAYVIYAVHQTLQSFLIIINFIEFAYQKLKQFT